ncbi:MAG TPA: hypothetical protein VF215_09645, partial [Thermoanaerobaculia bacterium]
AIDIRQVTDPTRTNYLPDGIANPGYVTPPSRVWYYFSGRGQYRADDVTSTNLAVNYESPKFHGAQFFVQTDIINIFNESAVEFPATARGNVINQTVLVNRNVGTLKPFNPFTTTPVEGVHYTKATVGGVAFGDPTNREAYQDPREYRLSVGVRF